MRHVGVHPCSKVERCPPPRQPPPRPPPRNTRLHLPSCRDATQTRIRALLRAWHAIQGSLPSQSSVATPAQREKPSRTPPLQRSRRSPGQDIHVWTICVGGGGGAVQGGGALEQGRMGISGLLKPVASCAKAAHRVVATGCSLFIRHFSDLFDPDSCST